MTTIKSTPLLVSSPLVRAILSGEKTQTRRLVRPPRGEGWRPVGKMIRTKADLSDPAFRWDRAGAFGATQWVEDRCPFGSPGDRLWVRETWRPEPACSLPEGWALRTAPGDVEDDGAEVAVRYHADGAIRFAGEPTGEWQWPSTLTPYRWGGKETRWMPSILMPRWASRINLEITEVRIQRLQDITEEDARAEGAPAIPRLDGSDPRYYRQSFAAIWDSIAEARGEWVDNPWVWAITFKMVQP